jgi:hypothetical protein
MKKLGENIKPDQYGMDKISKKLKIEAKMGGEIPAIRSVEEGTSRGVAEH